MTRKGYKLTAKELDDFFKNFHKNETEFKGKILSWTLDLELVLGNLLTIHFVKTSKKNDFFTIVLPKLNFDSKITILQSILELKEYSQLDSEETIQILRKIQKNRNKLAHWRSDLFQNMISSSKGKNDVMILNYKNGKLKKELLTKEKQEKWIRLIKDGMRKLGILSKKMKLISKDE